MYALLQLLRLSYIGSCIYDRATRGRPSRSIFARIIVIKSRGKILTREFNHARTWSIPTAEPHEPKYYSVCRTRVYTSLSRLENTYR